MKFIDVHTHLHDSFFDEDRGKIISEMKERGVGAIVVGTDLSHSKSAVQLAQDHNILWATVGLHPTDNPQEGFAFEEFEKMAKSQKVVAIGECGLDYWRLLARGDGANDEEKERQKEIFKMHLELARKLNKPLMIHCRPSKGSEDAHEDMIEILIEEKKKNENLKGVIHFFTGSKDVAYRYRNLGFFVSLSGVVTFAKELEEMVLSLPENSFLIESDAPFAAPSPFRGKKNTPLLTETTLKHVALIRGEDPQKMAQNKLILAKKVFSIGIN